MQLRKLRRAEYDQLVALGVFEGEKVELIRGAIVEMSPTRPSHAFVIQKLTRRLLAAVGDRADIRGQSSFVAADDSQPEPDLAVVAVDNDGHAHPSRAHLIIEVAESSLRTDREIKGPLYAESHVDEYWIVAIERRQVEVYRDPVLGRWNTAFTVGESGSVSPLAFPDLVIAVADILPKV